MTALAMALVSDSLRPLHVELRGTPTPEARAVVARERERHPRLAATVRHGSESEAFPSTPALLLQFVTHPDEFDLDRVAGWMRGSPGLRLLVVGGAWCLAAARNRHFEPAGLWVTEDQFPARLAVEFEAWEGGRSPLPPTADRSEVFLAESAASGSRLAFRIAVASPDDAFRELCEDELRGRGASIESVSAGTGEERVDALVLDADPALTSARPGDWKPSCPVLLLSTTPWAIPRPEPPTRMRVASKFAGGAVWSRELGELLSRSA